ncbi:LOW QUALITY PROTEIN: hypothetical protein KUTeg_001811 [Tegillarca granosa]|uniref:PiggyBac transposable element-derived protein domain-containing protein n=1 Tax=Tegillarca granosa TaxID=220873 RepID=A0ABQ9FSH8_TEGGR|nr:LOW QUALITY PROTEIN: hypothetical protein KUTeg_001811 [Tegillarca granosa]
MILFRQCVKETNRYARDFIGRNIGRLAPHSRVKAWRPVYFTEFKAFIAVIINMGLIQKPSIQEYLSSKITKTSWFSEVMSRNRFQNILKFFHVVKNNNTPNRNSPFYDPIGKVRPFVDHINTCMQFKRCYSPSQNLSIDRNQTIYSNKACEIRQLSCGC